MGSEWAARRCSHGTAGLRRRVTASERPARPGNRPSFCSRTATDRPHPRGRGNRRARAARRRATHCGEELSLHSSDDAVTETRGSQRYGGSPQGKRQGPPGACSDRLQMRSHPAPINRCPNLSEEAGRKVVGPLHGPSAQGCGGGFVEPIRGESCVVGPLRAREIRLEVFALEAATRVRAADPFELGIGPSPRGCEHVDQVAGRSAGGEGADLGPDYVLLCEDRPVRALGDRPPEDLLEDAFLPGGGVGHGEAGGQWGRSPARAPSSRGLPGRHGAWRRSRPWVPGSRWRRRGPGWGGSQGIAPARRIHG